MTNRSEIRKIAFVGDYVPRRCGIATFTHDIRHSVADAFPETACVVIPINDREESYDYADEVRFEIPERQLDGYRRAADFLNFNDYDVVSLQHEFGIFGGPAGSHILALLRGLRVPVVTTLHTVLKAPDAAQRGVMQQLAQFSARLVVMSQKGRTLLREIYDVPDGKIDVIPHGIPDMPFTDPHFYKDKFGVEGKQVLLTFGLLSPNKGIDVALRAMPRVVSEFPDVVYIVLGATHPHLVREQGESYRLNLQRLARDLGVAEHVAFYDRFVELDELMEFIGAADIYLTPYLNPAQITSGTLAYSFGCGKAVVSTPYWHAEELLADGRGVLVPFGDSAAIAREIVGLLRDEMRRHAMRKQAYILGREMIWSNVAQSYMHSFRASRHQREASQTTARRFRSLTDWLELPSVRVEHLLSLTDRTGLLQHATYAIPNFHEGYCTDDNARALLATIYLEELGEDTSEIERAATTYAGFLNYAFDESNGHWRNFLGFDRRWLETAGSPDSLGRLIWAVGACVGRSQRRDLSAWGVRLFEPALHLVSQTDAPRAWAYALLGIHEYLRRFDGDRVARHMREELTARLVALYERNATDQWPWFEPLATYDNARLSQAMIMSGRWSNLPRALEIGLQSLRWLGEVQHSPAGCFRPIGCHGFYPRGGEPAQFDQQPIEACAMVSASIEAFRATGDAFWRREAHRAFEWFLGRNDVQLEVVDVRTGGCRDGLHEDRANENQGAESTLSWLLALIEMKIFEGSFAPLDFPPNGHTPLAMPVSSSRPVSHHSS
jgi:glycosyltransferase involved in cell wall biosynthesis